MDLWLNEPKQAEKQKTIDGIIASNKYETGYITECEVRHP